MGSGGHAVRITRSFAHSLKKTFVIVCGTSVASCDAVNESDAGAKEFQTQAGERGAAKCNQVVTPCVTGPEEIVERENVTPVFAKRYCGQSRVTTSCFWIDQVNGPPIEGRRAGGSNEPCCTQ